MKKTLILNIIIIGIFLFLAFSAEKLVNGGSIGMREIAGSIIGALIGGLLAEFLMSRYYDKDRPENPDV